MFATVVLFPSLRQRLNGDARFLGRGQGLGPPRSKHAPQIQAGGAWIGIQSLHPGISDDSAVRKEEAVISGIN
ncbi:hypothetical protein VTJ04DRAFT_9238 [Mycothermus thermophilus]|uniref:uncharacterized protein n=1 Tax=Humicola insolens TaxID=85995 RepID=UPI003743A531